MFMSHTDRAMFFAMWQHIKAGHEYGHLPYFYHCEEVVQIAQHYMPDAWWKSDEFRSESGLIKSEIVVAAAYCHDIKEDTGLSYNDIASVIGTEAADLVYLLSDEPGKNRAERHARTYPKIAADRTAVFIKLCDRLANRLNASKAEMYDREYKAFSDIFYAAGEYDDLWTALDDAHNFNRNPAVTKITA